MFFKLFYNSNYLNAKYLLQVSKIRISAFKDFSQIHGILVNLALTNLFVSATYSGYPGRPYPTTQVLRKYYSHPKQSAGYRAVELSRLRGKSIRFETVELFVRVAVVRMTQSKAPGNVRR